MNQLHQKIAEEIEIQGAIPFSRFMELALYCPVYGYYEKQRDTIGRRGDFYTSVSVGSLFGELLAWQFAEWLQSAAKPGSAKFRLVEAGAHDGRLASDILRFLRENRPDCLARLEYVILEPSASRRQWQRQTLLPFVSHVRWLDGLSGLAAESAGASPPHSLIFSNEFLDALPVHRYGWDAQNQTWFEWGVTVAGKQFVWTRMTLAPGSSAERYLRSLPPELTRVLPDPFTVEVCPAAEEWWRAAAQVIGKGKLLTMDYGFSAEQLLVPERREGTLRGYHQHHATQDILAFPGEQDITAHVNFSAVIAAGEQAGLTTESFTSQSRFLTGIASQIAREKGEHWLAERSRQLQTLTDPNHLGQTFSVLSQSRAKPTVPPSSTSRGAASSNGTDKGDTAKSRH